MTTMRRTGGRRDPYLALVRRFPLRPVRSDAELDRAIAMVDELTDRNDLVAGERDYLDVLSDLIERYESEAHPIQPVTDAVMLAHLIEAKGVTQADVARGTKVAHSTISAQRAGKRRLNRPRIA